MGGGAVYELTVRRQNVSQLVLSQSGNERGDSSVGRAEKGGVVVAHVGQRGERVGDILGGEGVGGRGEAVAHGFVKPRVFAGVEVETCHALEASG